MSFKCCNCGHIFDECEIKQYEEPHGEITNCCPVCKETGFQETERCKICGGEFLEDELDWGICEDCVEDSIDFDNCYAFADDCEKEKVEINFLLASLFKASEIESILYNIAKNNTSYKELCDIMNFDKSRLNEFAEFISKKEDK